jgi:AraC family transcriptional regulator of adaptative response / DNA-3-methyladenine glycosylase II
VIDAHLKRTELAALVRQRPGIRVPAAFDGFETLLVALVHAGSRSRAAARRLARRLVRTFGESIETGIPGLDRLAPDAERVAGAGAAGLAALGVGRGVAECLSRAARHVADGDLVLEPGRDPSTTHQALLALGVSDHAATMVILRALSWPDAFPAGNPGLLRAGGRMHEEALLERAERWHPWRAYAAMHLWLSNGEEPPASVAAATARMVRWDPMVTIPRGGG